MVAFNGEELKEGDKVVFIATDQNKHRLKKGTVVGFENNIGKLCIIRYGNYDYKIRDTHNKVIKM